MAYYALTIFSGAFLLFLVQPLIGKYILPWFGGGPGVWSTCMVFFQTMLVGGYAYAHATSRWLRPKPQVLLHLFLLALAVITLPIVPSDAWKPSESDHPITRILALLTATIAVPYFVLSSTGPLMQHWFARTFPGKSPYRLFALSNAGSLLALLSYPFWIESQFTRHTQSWLWGAGLVFYAVFAAVSGWWFVRAGKAAMPSGASPDTSETGSSAKPRTLVVGLWLLLPACASALLLATTNKLCLDVAVVPFLWVMPLAIYLLSFIVAFDNPRWYARLPFTVLLAGALAAFCWAMQKGADWPVWRQAAIYGGALFICCMVCHGELYRLRPSPDRLTSFYLLIAVGGALGGLFVGLLAPTMFSDYYELHWALLLCGILFVVALTFGEAPVEDRYWKWLAFILPIIAVIGLDRWMAALQKAASLNKIYLGGFRVVLWLFLAGLVAFWFLRKRSYSHRRLGLWWITLGVCGLSVALWLDAREVDPDVMGKSRDFYGVLTVYNYNQHDPDSQHYLLQHGRITHGLQFVDPVQSRWATTYFGQESGVGIALRSLPEGPRKIGIVGLGAGTLAAYGREGDVVRFYEINPNVEKVARSPFSYIVDTPAKLEIARGDARLVMEREQPQEFDLLILDAFSSDSIPVHLLTREAFQLYGRHLKPGGAMAIHISNHYLDLEPIVRKLGDHFGYQYAMIDYEEREESWWVYSSTWILLSKNTNYLQSPLITSSASKLKPLPGKTQLWTDDFASLFPIMQK